MLSRCVFMSGDSDEADEAVRRAVDVLGGAGSAATTVRARDGDTDRAAALFRQAAAIAHPEPERRALLDRAEALVP